MNALTSFIALQVLSIPKVQCYSPIGISRSITNHIHQTGQATSSSILFSASADVVDASSIISPSPMEQYDDGASVVVKNSQSNINNNNSVFSPAATWHQNRRRQMLSKYGDEITPLERDSSSHTLALSLLLLSNISLFGLSILSGKLPLHQVAILALFPGSIFSLWTLQILHDLLHGSLLQKRQQTFLGGRIKRKKLQDWLLFWGSMPSAFGYYLYLKYGHLTHHKSLGDAEKGSLKQLFESDQKDFEDG